MPYVHLLDIYQQQPASALQSSCFHVSFHWSNTHLLQLVDCNTSYTSVTTSPPSLRSYSLLLLPYFYLILQMSNLLQMTQTMNTLNREWSQLNTVATILLTSLASACILMKSSCCHKQIFIFRSNMILLKPIFVFSKTGWFGYFSLSST